MRKAQTRVNLILELFYCPSHTRSRNSVTKKEEKNRERSRTSKEGFPSGTRACFVTRLHEKVGDYAFQE